MITLALGFIYGTGFAITLIGGTLWMMVLNLIHNTVRPYHVVGAAIVWPITLGIAIYKVYRFIQEEYAHELKRIERQS